MTIRGNSRQEIRAFIGPVAREIRERGTLCTRKVSTSATIEKGTVLDAPFKGVSVGHQGNIRIGKAESTSDVVLKSEMVNVVSIVITTRGADVGICRFRAGVCRGTR